jgi:hypothetical protein
LFEFIFDVEVIVFQFFLKICVFVEKIVEFVHFEVEILLGNFKLSDLFFVTLYLIVESELLLLENRFLGSEFFTVCGESHVFSLTLDQISLVGNPLLLNCDDLIFKFFSLLQDIVLLGLHGSRILINTSILELGPNSVKLINSKLSLVNSVVSLLDILLKLFDLVFFFLELGNQVIQLFLKKFVLLDTIEIIDSYSGNFVREILDLDFLLSNVLVSDLSLLQQVGGALLDCLLLRGMVDDIISDFLSLGVERHDGLLKDVHLLFDVGLLGVHSGGFILGLSDGVLEHHELLVESLSLILDFELSLFQEIFVTLHFLELGGKFFRVFLFFLGFISDTGNFRFNLENIILLLLDEFLDGLKCLVSLLHTEE